MIMLSDNKMPSLRDKHRAEEEERLIKLERKEKDKKVAFIKKIKKEDE